MPNAYDETDVVQLQSLKKTLVKVEQQIELLANKLDAFDAPMDGKYYVRGNGVWNEVTGAKIVKPVIDLTGDNGEETLTNIINIVRNGSITRKYPFGTKLVVQYTDPTNNTTYDLPFFFGTVQEFEKEDGSKFSGLGLVSEFGLPVGNISFDAAEPSNPDFYRAYDGSGRWKTSVLRQWMNHSGKNWFTSQHEYDAAPTQIDPTAVNGFLSCLPEFFINSVIPVKSSTKVYASDGGNYDVTYDKFFPLSFGQINCTCKVTHDTPADESEGRYWEYWREKTGSTDYLTGEPDSSIEAYNAGLYVNDDRILYCVEDHTQACNWWLRSAYLSLSSYAWKVTDEGALTDGLASENYYSNRVAPACVIG